MANARKAKPSRLWNQKLKTSLEKQKVMIKQLPQRFQRVMTRRMPVALRALHGFKGRLAQWGENKKNGPVQMSFKPVLGYKSLWWVEYTLKNKAEPISIYRPADFILGFEKRIGLPIRFMAYPSKTELKKFKALESLQKIGFPSDFVTVEANSLGNIGGTISFVGTETKPTFFIHSIKIRTEYYQLPKQIRRRYKGWHNRWIAEVEKQCRRLGFERIAWLSSTDHYFNREEVKIKADTKQALYKTLPEKRGYNREVLSVPTGME